MVIYGNKKYDRRGTVGTHHYTNFRHVKSIDNLQSYIEETISKFEGKVKLLGIDNVCEAKDINSFDFDSNVHYIMVFGQEQVGVPSDVLSMCDELLYIPQYGSVRSINVGTASGIIMNNYCAKVHSFVV